jgi:hypothetical protein
MIEDANPDMIYAFPLSDSKGTYDMIERAARAKIKTKIWREE